MRTIATRRCGKAASHLQGKRRTGRMSLQRRWAWIVLLCSLAIASVPGIRSEKGELEGCLFSADGRGSFCYAAWQLRPCRVSDLKKENWKDVSSAPMGVDRSAMQLGNCVRAGFRSRKNAGAFVCSWTRAVSAGWQTVPDYLRRNALCAGPAGLLARPAAHGQGDGA